MRRLGIGMLAVGVAIAAPLASGVKVFAEYEQNMATVKAVSGATAEEFAALDEVAKRMGRTTVFTARQSAEALTFMSMAGMEARQSVEALPHVLNLAAAGQIELGNAADIVTNIMAGYGLQTDQLGMAVDVLTVGFTSANTNLQQLGEAFAYAGPVAAAAGIDFNETAAALSLMGNAGFQSTLAGTALRGAITRMLNPTGQAKEVLDRLGITVLDAEGNMRPLIDIVRELEEGGLTAGDAMTLFGQRAGPAMLALISQGSNALEELRNDMQHAGGTAHRIADTQLDTFQGSLTLLKSAVEGLQLAIGAVLTPSLRDFVDLITPIIQGIVEWAEENPELRDGLVKLAGAVALLAIAVGLFAIGGAVVTTWKAGWAAMVATAQVAWLRIVAATVFGMAGVVLTTATGMTTTQQIYALGWLKLNLIAAAGWVRQQVIDAAGWLKQHIMWTLGWVKQHVIDAAGWLKRNVMQAAGWVKQHVIDAAGWLKQHIMWTLGWVKQHVIDAAGWLKRNVMQAAGWVKQHVIDAAGWLKQHIMWGLGWLRQHVIDAAGWLKRVTMWMLGWARIVVITTLGWARVILISSVSLLRLIAMYAVWIARSLIMWGIWAIKMAAMWLVAMGPVGWVIGLLAVIAAMAAILMLNWDKIDGQWRSLWNRWKNTVVENINKIIDKINELIQLWNSIPVAPDIPEIGQVDASSVPTPTLEGLLNIASAGMPGVGGKLGAILKQGADFLGGTSSSSDTIPIEALHTGGIVRSPILATLAERGPEAVIPLNRAGPFGQTVINMYVQGSIIDREGASDLLTNVISRRRQQGLAGV